MQLTLAVGKLQIYANYTQPCAGSDRPAGKLKFMQMTRRSQPEIQSGPRADSSGGILSLSLSQHPLHAAIVFFPVGAREICAEINHSALICLRGRIFIPDAGSRSGGIQINYQPPIRVVLQRPVTTRESIACYRATTPWGVITPNMQMSRRHHCGAFTNSIARQTFNGSCYGKESELKMRRNVAKE